MTDLTHLVYSRGNYRGQVNSIYNDKASFSEKNSEEKERLVKKLNRLQDELNKLDSIIREMKWEKNADDEGKAISEKN